MNFGSRHLQLADVQLVKECARITIRHSKTDQEGEGQVIAIPSGQTILPVARLKAWLAVGGARCAVRGLGRCSPALPRTGL